MNEPKVRDPQSPRGDVRTVAVGTVVWAVALVVLLPFWSRLDDEGLLWLVPMCACGVALGFVGLAYTRRRAAAIERDERAARSSSNGPSTPES